MADFPGPDKRAVRRSFDRVASKYDVHAVLQREVAARMFERLDFIRIVPGAILDAGCGTGGNLAELGERYPGASRVGLDIASAMLGAARRRLASTSLLGRLASVFRLPVPASGHIPLACGDVERLPFRDAAFDMVWSNFTIQWLATPDAFFRECRRVLREEGLVIFTTLGPDTLKELRAAFAEVDGEAHVNRFLDMHDVGDALVHSGFASPVLEVERIVLTYDSVRGVLDDLKAIGAHTVAGQKRGLMGRGAWQRFEVAYERFRDGGRLPATFEVVFGHAWAGARAAPGEAKPIRLNFPSRKLR